MLMACAMIGFGQGFQPVCSFNYGAGLKERVKEGFFFCVRYGTIFLALLSVGAVAFAPQIIGWFRDDPAVIAVGSVALRAQAVTLPVLGTTTMVNMMLQSIGSGKKASITSSARNGIFFVPAILLLPHLIGLAGVEYAQAVADVCSLALCIPIGWSDLKKM